MIFHPRQLVTTDLFFPGGLRLLLSHRHKIAIARHTFFVSSCLTISMFQLYFTIFSIILFDNMLELVQKGLWRRTDDKPLFEPTRPSWLTYICISQPQTQLHLHKNENHSLNHTSNVISFLWIILRKLIISLENAETLIGIIQFDAIC